MLKSLLKEEECRILNVNIRNRGATRGAAPTVQSAALIFRLARSAKNQGCLTGHARIAVIITASPS